MRNTFIVTFLGSLLLLGACGKNEAQDSKPPIEKAAPGTKPAAEKGTSPDVKAPAPKEASDRKLPFQVVSQSADAKVEAARVSGTVTLKMNATNTGKEQNYRFKLQLAEGGSVELRARAKADLTGGVVLKFARTKDGVTMHFNGDDLTADVKKAIILDDATIDVNIDIHDHGVHAHGMYAVNGKKGATADFRLAALQGNWGFVVNKASVSDFAVGPAKHED